MEEFNNNYYNIFMIVLILIFSGLIFSLGIGLGYLINYFMF